MTSKVFLAIRVPAGPTRAFEAFTQDIAAWWRPDPLFGFASRREGASWFGPGPEAGHSHIGHFRRRFVLTCKGPGPEGRLAR